MQSLIAPLLSALILTVSGGESGDGECTVTVLSAEVAETWEGTATYEADGSLILCRSDERYLALGFQGPEPFRSPRIYRVGEYGGMRLRASMQAPGGEDLLSATGGEVRLTQTWREPVTGYFALAFEDGEVGVEARGTFSAVELKR